MSYSDITFNDKNFFKRWIQKRRLLDALSILKLREPLPNPHCLDFGGGNGELSKLMASTLPSAQITCYEPTPELFKEAQQNLQHYSRTTCISNINTVAEKKFDYIFCLEVFEHLPPDPTANCLKQIKSLLAPNGTLVIGVPHEIYLPALLKGMFRIIRRYGAYDATILNILRCMIGFPPKNRPISTIDAGQYHFEHLGFDYRSFKKKLSEFEFQAEKIFFSPLKCFRSVLNSEVYFILRNSQTK